MWGRNCAQSMHATGTYRGKHVGLTLSSHCRRSGLTRWLKAAGCTWQVSPQGALHAGHVPEGIAGASHGDRAVAQARRQAAQQILHQRGLLAQRGCQGVPRLVLLGQRCQQCLPAAAQRILEVTICRQREPSQQLMLLLQLNVTSQTQDSDTTLPHWRLPVTQCTAESICGLIMPAAA